MMKQQKGCIYRTRGQWALRWRENAVTPEGGIRRKMRFKTLGPVTAEHKRNSKRIPPEIQAKANEYLEPVNSGAMSSALLTIGQLIEEYFRNKHFKPSTESGYKKIWQRYLQARLQAELVRDFKRSDAFRLWKQIHAEHPTLSKRTMQHIRFFVSGIFEFAKNVGYYSGENPATADLPEGLPLGKETEAYTLDEVVRLLSLLASPKSQAIVALAWGSGLRKGEIEGLDWRDYEPTDTGATIHVRRSVWRRHHITTPKTESSADDVHIGPEIVEYIEAYRRFLRGVTEGFMFGYSATHPIDLESFVRYELKPVMQKAGMKYKGLHGFRRAAATFLAKQISGNGLRAASLVLRHSDETVTQNHYVKNSKQDRRAMQAARVAEMGETRKSAAAILGAGLRQTAVN